MKILHQLPNGFDIENFIVNFDRKTLLKLECHLSHRHRIDANHGQRIVQVGPTSNDFRQLIDDLSLRFLDVVHGAFSPDPSR